MKCYNDFYKDLLGFEPYAFQSKVAKLLLDGKNVILSVPTGAGKTWASVMPFLYVKHCGNTDFPQKMIYSLPLRTLTNSIYNDIHDLVKQSNVQQKYPDLSGLLSIQTGEYNDDPYFEKEIIFSTIDQTLSNFLCFPLAVSHNQANINAGAIIGSYLVFDEFHLLDSRLSMATTIGMLRILKNLCRICIMTATLTTDFIQYLKNELQDFEIVSIKDFPIDIPKINSLRPADNKIFKKAIHISNEVLNSNAILDCHKKKTIVICNRVETAQRIFLELKSKKKKTTELICIHSRFFDNDRKEKESLIKEYFGKGNKKNDVILVATQVIEAGMDISCDVMFTEISPINSFLQRAGRCARFAKEYGDIYVCDVLSMEEKDLISENNNNEQDANEIRKLNNKYLPYQIELCQNSMAALKSIHNIDEEISEVLVNKVLKDKEKNNSKAVSANLYNIDKIERSWLDCDRKHYRETIRDIQSIEIVLLDVDKYGNKRINPWEYETISIYKWSFIGWIKRIRQDVKDLDTWIIGKAERGDDSQFDIDWQDKNDYYLRRLDFSELKDFNDIIFVNNRYFDYNEAGLFVSNNENGKVSPSKNKLAAEFINIVYRKDTFYQHNKALLNCYEVEFKPKMSFLFKQLDKFWGSEIDWDKLIKITICFHDYGKLNAAWQKPMLEFQRKKMNDESYFEILAHTDYDKTMDSSLAKECNLKGKPAHAGIGAVQVYDMLFDDYGEKIARIAACAIMKHHGIGTDSFENFIIPEKNLSDLIVLAKEIDIKYAYIKKERGESLVSIIPNKDKEKLLYLLLVRILRLCDQKATGSIEKYYRL
jgi:CRISPR-associated endonuclease/helicase Cas3